MDFERASIEKIRNKKAKIGIVGVGYVGTALMLAALDKDYKVLGFSRSIAKVRKLNRLGDKKFRATNDFSKLASCDIICICVPTPIHEDKTPYLGPLDGALEKVATYLQKGQLIIIESSIGVGMTRKIALKTLEAKTKLRAGIDFFLAYSPERVDPGNNKFSFKNIPKVVAGLDDTSKRLATNFYKNIVNRVVPVSSLEVAEMSKLLENTFRLVNISFINELANYTKAVGIDIWEVVDAASSKPFGFLPHYPGPGVGGHCIPVDPYYLLHDARKRNIKLSLVEEAGRINDEQTEKVVKRAVEILKETNGENKPHRILLIGLAYKPDVSDVRESAALKILSKLQRLGFSVSYHDPHIPHINGIASKELTENVLDKHDLIIIITNHSTIDYATLLKCQKPILDTRNVLKYLANPHVFHI